VFDVFLNSWNVEEPTKPQPHQEHIMVALFVIIFVVALVTVDLIIQARHKKYPLMAKSPAIKNAAMRPEALRMPKGIFFHPGHTWARMQAGNEIVVGMDDFLQKALGAVEKVILPLIGQKVSQGDPVITVQRGGKTLSLVAPVSGKVYAVNHDVIDNPALLMENPYDDGWLFMIEPEQLASNLSILSIAENAVAWLKNETARFRDFVASHAAQPALAGETMLDGGMPVHGSLEFLDDEGLKKFEQEFLRAHS
jgi:glycine cleavage system H lipoate-binding protein